MPETHAVTYGQLLAENIRLEAQVKELEAENLRIREAAEDQERDLEAYTGEYALRARVEEIEGLLVTNDICFDKAIARAEAAEARVEELDAETARLKIAIADLKAALAEATGEPGEIEWQGIKSAPARVKELNDLLRRAKNCLHPAFPQIGEDINRALAEAEKR